MPNELLNFAMPLEFAKESEKKGTFKGILVKYGNKKLAHGRFRFIKDSMKKNNNKKLFILFMHNGEKIPVGMMKGKSTDEGFMIEGELDLTLLENGNPINPAAHALYSLMTNKGADFELSVGGYIVKASEKKEDDKWFYEIEEFDAYEGSIVMRGAVQGSKITEVFKEKENTNKTEVEQKMTIEEIKALFTEQFKSLKDDMNKANTSEEIEALKAKYEDVEKSFNELPKQLQESFDVKFAEIDKVLKTLKHGYAEQHQDEFNEIDELYAVFSKASRTNENFLLSNDEKVELTEEDKKHLKFAATTTALPDAIKPKYVNKILERLQAANPLLAEIDFLSIADNSLKITREEIGLPTSGIVGETDSRDETTTPTLDNVAIELYQWYVLPVVSNKLLATNYVGYLPFLIKRAEYSLALLMANKLTNGSGTNEPLGILNDTNITQTVDFKLQTGGADLDNAVFAQKIKTVYYTPRTEIAEKAKWAMRRATWSYISNLQNGDKNFYVGTIQQTGERTLMNRPVIIVEDDNSGISDIATGNGDNIMIFGDFKNGIQGIMNNQLSISIEDKVTSKGFTKYYIEKGAGFGVKLPENFVIVTNTTD